jgi:hypothetical protein
MRKAVRLSAMLCLALVAICAAAERQWQVGTWTKVDVSRRIVDFGPGSGGFSPPSSVPSMRAMAEVRTFVIETDTLRLDLKDVVPVNRRSVDVEIGTKVTFAIDKGAVYVRDADGTEHKLQLVKKVPKTGGS